MKLRPKLIESSFTGSTGVMGGTIVTTAQTRKTVKIGRRQPRRRQQHVSFQRNLQWLIQKSIIRKVSEIFRLGSKGKNSSLIWINHCNLDFFDIKIDGAKRYTIFIFPSVISTEQ